MDKEEKGQDDKAEVNLYHRSLDKKGKALLAEYEEVDQEMPAAESDVEAKRQRCTRILESLIEYGADESMIAKARADLENCPAGRCRICNPSKTWRA